ncbi:MAG: VCBS repeat-containing protein [Planctomycetota bacterium]|nr:VCBS repeat-containing protein [Planctomycetota bacterium]
MNQRSLPALILSCIGGLLPAAALPGQVPSAGWKKHLIVPPARGMINSAVAHDFDGDKNMDVITSHDGEIYLVRGPHWKKQLIHRFDPRDSRRKPRRDCIHSCLLDVDSDGDLDFIGSSNTVFWLECPDQPFAEKPWTYRVVDDEVLGTHCLITADVNRDGQLDLIANSGRKPNVTTIPNSLTWMEIPPHPKMAKHWIRHVFADGTAPGGSHYAGFADINRDGRGDICYGAKGGDGFAGGEWFAWWEQPEDPTGPWKKHLLSDKQPGASNILPADLDGDGQMDFVASRGHGKGVLWFRGPSFRPIEIDNTLVGPHSLALVDLDRDGDWDIATCGRQATGKAVWYENDGRGHFDRHLIGTDQGSYDMRAIDMDGDGDQDFLIAGHESRNVVWYENRLPVRR